MFTVVARYSAEPSQADAVADLLPALAAASRAEAGNISYVVTRDLEDTSLFIIVEQYRTAEDFQTHRDSEHFQRIGVGQIIPMLRDRTVDSFETAAS